MNHLYKLVFTALTIFAAPVIAQESGVSFYHKAWSVACDNTLTCRIGGHSVQENVGGVLLTRAAGEHTATAGEIILPEDRKNEAPVKKLTLWLNGQPAGEATQKANRWWLSEAQTLALIDAVKGSGTVGFKSDRESFQLSGDGAYAALLKVDDVQGRIGTPGAWVKKGDRPESGVAKAVAMPVIQAVKVSPAQSSVLTKKEAEALRPQLLAVLTSEQQCDYLTSVGEKDVNGNIISGDITATPLDDTHTLLSTQCWGAAYNQGYGYWVTDSQLKAKPVAVTTDAQTWHDGVITNVFMGSSAGSCASKEEWIWDGAAFRQSLATINDGCWFPRTLGNREIPGLLSEIKREGIK
ncbi:DUF1176 domain-containing protein [Erwinia sp. DT-104]|uniref:DUF1176 domain-containing protein n=1 Tax=Erwinia sp. DT-104 TaxID=3396161 RepID=UPI003F19D5E0